MNLLTKSLNEVCRGLPEGGWMGPPKFGESEVERYWRLTRDDSPMFVGRGDTLSPIGEYLAAAISVFTSLNPSLTVDVGRAPRR